MNPQLICQKMLTLRFYIHQRLGKNYLFLSFWCNSWSIWGINSQSLQKNHLKLSKVSKSRGYDYPVALVLFTMLASWNNAFWKYGLPKLQTSVNRASGRYKRRRREIAACRKLQLATSRIFFFASSRAKADVPNHAPKKLQRQQQKFSHVVHGIESAWMSVRHTAEQLWRWPYRA